MIACQLRSVTLSTIFKGKPRRFPMYFWLKMAADLKWENLEFKSLVSGHLYEDFFTFFF